MALTVTTADENVAGARKTKVVNVTFDSSYPTGGEGFTPASVGFVSFTFVDIAPSDGYVYEFDYTNNKIIAYWVDTTTDGAPMAQVADTTDLSGAVTKARLEGF